jgi:hypothetical protein
MRKYALPALLAVLPLVLSGARLTLRDGTVIYGQFVSGTPNTIVFRDDNGIQRRFDLDQVQGIDFSRMAADASRGLRGSADRADDRYANDWAVVPAGRTISVRTEERIDPENVAEGRRFPATIVQDIPDGSGNVVVPAGSPATLIVRRVSGGGALAGPRYVLDLDSVRVNGRRYVVNTSEVTAGGQGIGKNRRTAEYVGGGAALGTLLGAIAGGGKGAAIGAIAGAATGGGVQVLTAGREIRVPAETVLNFRLERPLHLRESAY